VARSHLPYGVFLIAMLVAGCGAGLLNGQTVKVLQNAVSEDRAGMASGIASTTRFIGILVSVATLGAVLANVARDAFLSVSAKAGLSPAAAEAGAAQVTSGDLSGLLAAAPAAARETLRTAGLEAYGSGFASAALIAAGIAVVACLLAFALISGEETAPPVTPTPVKFPCKVVDCRDPL
jgi:hypothetical protein